MQGLQMSNIVPAPKGGADVNRASGKKTEIAKNSDRPFESALHTACAEQTGATQKSTATVSYDVGRGEGSSSNGDAVQTDDALTPTKTDLQNDSPTVSDDAIEDQTQDVSISVSNAVLGVTLAQVQLAVAAANMVAPQPTPVLSANNGDDSQTLDASLAQLLASVADNQTNDDSQDATLSSVPSFPLGTLVKGQGDVTGGSGATPVFSASTMAQEAFVSATGKQAIDQNQAATKENISSLEEKGTAIVQGVNSEVIGQSEITQLDDQKTELNVETLQKHASITDKPLSNGVFGMFHAASSIDVKSIELNNVDESLKMTKAFDAGAAMHLMQKAHASNLSSGNTGTSSTVSLASNAQFSDALQSALNENYALPRRIEVKLQTPPGGTVSIYLTQTNGQVRVQMSASTEGSYQWLQQEMTQLQKMDFGQTLRWLPAQMESQQQQAKNERSNTDSRAGSRERERERARSVEKNDGGMLEGIESLLDAAVGV